MQKKKGKIRISSAMLADIESSYKYFNAVFSDFVPVFIDRDFNGSYYSGFCKYFDEIEEGVSIPEYEVVITDTSGVVNVSYIRI